MKSTFTEVQKFSPFVLAFIYLITLPIIAFLAYGLYVQFVQGKPFGNLPTSDTELLLISAIGISFCLGFIYLFKSICLQTEINQEAISIKFNPFVNKTILWRDVKSAEVIKYGFVGGWGIRLWTKYGTVYNIKGSIGLRLELNNGKKVLIGTQKEKELMAFLDNMGLPM